MNVLDLPMNKQEELARMMGQSHADWVVGVKKRLEESAIFLKKVQEIEDLSESNLTPEERKRFQDKMDSGSPR